MEPRITRYPNGNIHRKDYISKINGEWHREDGPAAIGYYEDGSSILYEQYCLHDKLHRNDGPAYITYYENGNIKYQEYYINGNEIPLKTVQTMIKDLGIPEDHREWDEHQRMMFQFHFLTMVG